jgi:hypothetical protein
LCDEFWVFDCVVALGVVELELDWRLSLSSSTLLAH